MRKDYTPIDLFRYVKFLEENPQLKNNVTAISEYDKEFPKLTAEQALENIKNFDWRDGKCELHDDKTCDCPGGNCIELNPPLH